MILLKKINIFIILPLNYYANNINIVCNTIILRRINTMPVNSFENYPMSWKPILNNNDNPIYLTLASTMEEDIKSGVLLPGTKLPPQRELADYLDINLSTVTRAFKLCEKKGLICGVVGKGTFISQDAAAEKVFIKNDSTKPIIEMGAIMPHASSNQIITQFIHKLTQDPDSYKLFQYSFNEQDSFEKASAIKWLEKAGLFTMQNRLLFSSGGQNAIMGILSALFSPGDKIGTDPTTYPGFKLAASILGIQVVPLYKPNEEISREKLIAILKTERIKGLYVIPDFHNPTAITMSIKNRQMIAEVANEQKILVIEDAINTMLHPNPLHPIAFYNRTDIIYISSISKVLAPGFRLGIIDCPPRFKTAIYESLYAMNISVSQFLLHLFARLVSSYEDEAIRKSRQDEIQKRNKYINEYFLETELLGDIYSPHRYLLLPDNINASAFEAQALKKGVQIYAIDRFIVGAKPSLPSIRIAITAPNSWEDFQKGVSIIYNLYKNLS